MRGLSAAGGVRGPRAGFQAPSTGASTGAGRRPPSDQPRGSHLPATEDFLKGPEHRIFARRHAPGASRRESGVGGSLGRRVSGGRPGERPGGQRPGSGCSVLSRPHHSNRFSGALPPSAPQQPGKGDYPNPCDPARPTLRNPLAPPCILIPAEKAAIEARPLGLSRHSGPVPPLSRGRADTLSWLPQTQWPASRGLHVAEVRLRRVALGQGNTPHIFPAVWVAPPPRRSQRSHPPSPPKAFAATQQGGRWRRSWVPRAGPCADLSGAPRC